MMYCQSNWSFFKKYFVHFCYEGIPRRYTCIIIYIYIYIPSIYNIMCPCVCMYVMMSCMYVVYCIYVYTWYHISCIWMDPSVWMYVCMYVWMYVCISFVPVGINLFMLLCSCWSFFNVSSMLPVALIYNLTNVQMSNPLSSRSLFNSYYSGPLFFCGTTFNSLKSLPFGTSTSTNVNRNLSQLVLIPPRDMFFMWWPWW